MKRSFILTVAFWVLVISVQAEERPTAVYDIGWTAAGENSGQVREVPSLVEGKDGICFFSVTTTLGAVDIDEHGRPVLCLTVRDGSSPLFGVGGVGGRRGTEGREVRYVLIGEARCEKVAGYAYLQVEAKNGGGVEGVARSIEEKEGGKWEGTTDWKSFRLSPCSPPLNELDDYLRLAVTFQQSGGEGGRIYLRNLRLEVYAENVSSPPVAPSEKMAGTAKENELSVVDAGLRPKEGFWVGGAWGLGVGVFFGILGTLSIFALQRRQQAQRHAVELRRMASLDVRGE